MKGSKASTIRRSNAPAGKDATQDFEEIGHSNSAKKLLEKYVIGKFEVSCVAPPATSSFLAEMVSPSHQINH